MVNIVNGIAYLANGIANLANGITYLANGFVNNINSNTSLINNDSHLHYIICPLRKVSDFAEVTFGLQPNYI